MPLLSCTFDTHLYRIAPDIPSCSVKNRPHQVYASFSHSVPAYLDETYPISIDVTNQDDRELEITLDILLQPGEDDQGESLL